MDSSLLSGTVSRASPFMNAQNDAGFGQENQWEDHNSSAFGVGKQSVPHWAMANEGRKKAPGMGHCHLHTHASAKVLSLTYKKECSIKPTLNFFSVLELPKSRAQQAV